MSNPHTHQRHQHLQQVIINLYEKLAYFEREYGITADPARKFDLKHQIKEIKQTIQNYESEQAQLEAVLKSTPPPVTPSVVSVTQTNFTDVLSILKPLGDNEEYLRRLEEQIKGNGVIPFVGAGLSIPFGMPAWNTFLLKMAEKRGMKEQIQQRLDVQEYEEAAEDLLAEYGARAFHDQIEAAFGNHKWAGQSFADKAVSVLPFLAVGPVITTNYDQILEEAFRQSSRPFERVVIGTRPDLIAKALQSGNQFLLKVHGDVDDRTDRILTLAEYQHHYGTTAASPVDLSKPLPAHLQAMMTNRPLLFVGCSLNQDRMTDILTHIAKTLPGVAHYAIVVKPNDLQKFRARARQLSDFGIRPIWYPEDQHNFIQLILEYLANRPQPVSQPAVVPQTTPQTDQGKLLETLTKITEVDFGKLVFLLGARTDIPGDGVPQATRAVKLLEWAESHNRLPELVTILETRIVHRPL